MPIRLWQEVKALRWPWLAAFALTLAFPYAFVLALASLLVAGSVFGREFGYGTVGWLLSQPVSRERLWWERLGVAAGAVTLLAIVPLWAGQEPLHLAVLAAGALASALGFSLLSRHEWGGLAFGAGMPFVLYLALGLTGAFRGVPWDDAPVLLSRLGIAYTVALFGVGYLALRRLEDRGEAGAALGGLSLPWAPGRVSPTWALLVKELLLQRGVLVFVLPLCGLLLYAQVGGLQPDETVLVGILCGIVVFLGALAIGAFAIAEERTLGTFEAQLAQPVSRTRQFVLKLGVTWAVTLVCAGLPWALASLPGGVEPEHLKPWTLFPLLSALGCLLAATATFLAAEFSRGVVQALGKAIVIGSIGLFVLRYHPILANPFDPHLPTRLLILVLVALAVTVWLGWRNFGIAPGNRFIRVFGAMTGVVAVASLGTGVYSGWYVWSGVRDCLHGSGSACLGAAAVYQAGFGVPRVPRLATWLLERACRQADAPADNVFPHRVVSYHGRDGVTTSLDLSRGEPARACLHLGRMYESGANGVDQDVTRATGYYVAACEAGYASGCDALVAMLDGGRRADDDGLRQALGSGAEAIARRCDAQPADVPACLWLADAHRDGRWVAADVSAAESYARRACRAGEPRGCDRVVTLLTQRADAAELESGLAWVARQLDRQCSGVRPSPLPCAKLGRAYEAGRGVTRDVAKGRALLATYCPLAASGQFQMPADSLAQFNPWDSLYESTWWSERADDLAQTCKGYPLSGTPGGNHQLRTRELTTDLDE